MYDQTIAVLLFTALCLVWAGLGGFCVVSTWRRGEYKYARNNFALWILGFIVFAAAWI